MHELLQVKIDPNQLGSRTDSFRNLVEIVDIDYLLRAINILVECRRRMRRSDDARLLLEITLYKLSNLSALEDINSLINSIQDRKVNQSPSRSTQANHAHTVVNTVKRTSVAQSKTQQTPSTNNNSQLNNATTSKAESEPECNNSDTNSDRPIMPMIAQELRDKHSEAILASYLDSAKLEITADTARFFLKSASRSRRLEKNKDLLKQIIDKILDRNIMVQIFAEEERAQGKKAADRKTTESIIKDKPGVARAIDLLDGFIEMEE
jgi:DNA polymerase III gamma/tau subunit